MYLLAGLMGLMAMGSVAIVTIGDPYLDDDLPPDDGDDGDTLSSGASGGGWAAFDDEASGDGRSLFDRMGLINMSEFTPSAASDPAETGPVEGAKDLAIDQGLSGPESDVLKLHGYRIDLMADIAPTEDETDSDAIPADPSRGDRMNFDVEQDQLLILFDDTKEGPEPELDLRISDDDPDTTEVLLGDKVLARLPTEETPPLSAIVLVAESDAAVLGLTG